MCLVMLAKSARAVLEVTEEVEADSSDDAHWRKKFAAAYKNGMRGVLAAAVAEIDGMVADAEAA
eukprot:SAG22_NODE_1558_length_4129_cov_2.138213_4_plen_64_part_00